MTWSGLLLGFVTSAAIGYAGYTKGALDRSGMVGAIVVGTLIFGLGGWDWGVLLICFFISSSVLSRYREREKAPLAEKFAKGHQRDWGQTLANGGLGALLAVASALLGSSSPPLLLAAFVGAMAAVNADTWATEVGVLSRTPPRLITSGRKVEVGASGGVTTLGTAASLAGAAFIGLLAGLLQLASGGSNRLAGSLPLAGAVSGLAGSLFDSLLGATSQAIYYCDRCAKETERALHRCGARTRQMRGWRWLNNDLVNFVSSAVGAAVAVSVVTWLL